MFFRKPGASTKRQYSGYDEDQDARYLILNDLAYSVAYGFDQCRMPTPGATRPAAEVAERVGEVERGWRGEAAGRPGNGRARGMRASDLSTYHQQHLAERLRLYPRTMPPMSLKEGF